MKRLRINNLSPEDLLTYRRWRRGFLFFYCLAVIAALAIGSMQTATELAESPESRGVSQAVTSATLLNSSATK